jgi:predicted NUDIX family phosphoesterase
MNTSSRQEPELFTLPPPSTDSRGGTGRDQGRQGSRRGEEFVLAFRRSVLDDLGWFQGFKLDYAPYLSRIFAPGRCHFLRRDAVEHDPSWKQIIPYVLVVSEGKVLFYVRGQQSGEERLVRKGSIGFGGHISVADNSLFHDHSNAFDMYSSAVVREINEEVELTASHGDRITGVINDENDEVGRVHFGIVHRWHVSEPKVKKREQLITQLQFISPADLQSREHLLEGWSRICLRNLQQILAL